MQTNIFFFIAGVISIAIVSVMLYFGFVVAAFALCLIFPLMTFIVSERIF